MNAARPNPLLSQSADRGNAVTATELTRRYGAATSAVDALRGVSLAVRRGELVGIMGPSGSGKSTLLHILAGLDRPTSGEVEIGGRALSRLGDRDLTLLRRTQVGFVFQFFNLLPMLTAEGNIVLPLKLAGIRQDPAWVDELIGKVGLGARRDHLPAQLSGGQQQRVAIARALVMRPTVIFADEPTGNLDSRSGTEILDLLRASAQAYHQTIVMVTHEPKVSTVADRIVLLADGRIVDELTHPSATAVLRAIEKAIRPGVSVSGLVRAIRGIAPSTAAVNTATQQASTATSDVGRQFALLRYVLLAFGAVALLVGSFIIFNTLSITVAQRTRELATVRTLGASRRQVLASILAEGTIIGTISSVLGLGAGIGFAKGLSALLGASGIQLPAAATVVSWRTAAISLTAGIAVTLAASAAPALRAMRIAPIAAIREGTAPCPGSRRRRFALIAVALVVGAGTLVPAVVLGGLPATSRLVLLAGGALVLFIGVAGASRWIIGPLAAAIEKPVEPFTRGTGELAREDTRRNPARTATTAAALTIGVALVAFAAVMAQGLRAATGTSVRHQVTADYVITARSDVLAPDVQHALAAAGITSASVRAGTVHAFGTNQTITGVTPADIARFYRFRWVGGSASTALASLDADGVLVASDFAAAHHLKTGTVLTAGTTAGTTLRLVVRGVYAAPKLSPMLGAMTITTTLFDRSFTTPGDRAVLVAAGGTGPASRAAIQTALKPFPTAQIRTLAGFITLQQAPVATLLNMFYVLLALSVLISLFGIVNTLALSITERTREIGVLRALGMTRTQLRRMIRLESEIIALIGAVIGIAVGLLLAALAARTLSAWDVGFAMPWATLAILLGGAFAAGTVAGIGPARRAARLDPLEALSYE